VVDLAGRDRDKVGGYSFGMRQRLGVAASLLREPRLLVLDEPANGLDPAGIRDMRALVKRLAGSGLTVLLSCTPAVALLLLPGWLVRRGRRESYGLIGEPVGRGPGTPPGLLLSIAVIC
jgi:ABC-type taurine transport system ATPase subunit